MEMTLSKQVADALRVVRKWSPKKRASVCLEGGIAQGSMAGVEENMKNAIKTINSMLPTGRRVGTKETK